MFFKLVILADGIIIGAVIALLCKLLFGDSPLARLARLLLSVAGGIAYTIMCFAIGYSTSNNISTGLTLFIIFAPVAAFIILAILGYMFDKEK